MAKTRVFVATALSTLWGELLLTLSQQDDVSVIGLCTGEPVAPLVKELVPDVLLLDEALIEAEPIALLSEFSVAPRTLIFNGRAFDAAALAQLIPMGVRGFLPETSTSELLNKAIKVVSDGGLWFERRFLEYILLREETSEDSPQVNLPTPRELEIIACVRLGMTNKETARHLGISDKTVKVHLNHIFSKLGVTRRIHLALPGPFAANKPSIASLD